MNIASECCSYCHHYSTLGSITITWSSVTDYKYRYNYYFIVRRLDTSVLPICKIRKLADRKEIYNYVPEQSGSISNIPKKLIVQLNYPQYLPICIHCICENKTRSIFGHITSQDCICRNKTCPTIFEGLTELATVPPTPLPLFLREQTLQYYFRFGCIL